MREGSLWNMADKAPKNEDQTPPKTAESIQFKISMTAKASRFFGPAIDNTNGSHYTHLF